MPTMLKRIRIDTYSRRKKTPKITTEALGTVRTNVVPNNLGTKSTRSLTSRRTRTQSNAFRRGIDSYKFVLLLLTVASLTLCSCGKNSAVEANRVSLRSDEQSRELLQRMAETLDPSLSYPLILRRQEDLEEELSRLSPRSETLYYLFTAAPREIVEGHTRAVPALLAVDRTNGSIYEIFGHRSDANAFDKLATGSQLVIDTPEKAFSLVWLYHRLTVDRDFSFIQNYEQLHEDVTRHFDPKGRHIKEAAFLAASGNPGTDGKFSDVSSACPLFIFMTQFPPASPSALLNCLGFSASGQLSATNYMKERIRSSSHTSL